MMILKFLYNIRKSALRWAVGNHTVQHLSRRNNDLKIFWEISSNIINKYLLKWIPFPYL